MADDIYDPFEQRVRDMFARFGSPETPELTPERRNALRKLVPSPAFRLPGLTLLWRRAAGGRGIGEALEIIASHGLVMTVGRPVLMRDGDDSVTLPEFSLKLPGGTLCGRVAQEDNRRAKVHLSVKGAAVGIDEYSVEVSEGDRLLEARPLERKAEITLSGQGDFTLTFFSGEEAVGTIQLNVREEKTTADD